MKAAQGKEEPVCERSHLSCRRTCFLAGALVGGGWVMAAPRNKVGGCALERPSQAWTMLGQVAGLKESSLSHEDCLKDNVLYLLTSDLPHRLEGGS